MKRILLLSLSAGMIALTFSSYTNGPFAGGAGNHTGSAGTVADCSTGSGCHATNTTNTSGTLGVTTLSNGIVTKYTAGTTYKVTITAANTASRPKFGFQASCVKAAATSTQAGSFTATSSNVHVSNPTGLQMVEHSTQIAGITAGAYQVSFNWTAPAAGTGTVRFYSIVNAVNGDNTSSSDQPNALAAYNLDEATSTAVASIAPLNISVYPNPATAALHLVLAGNAECLVHVYDLTGRIVIAQTATVQNNEATISTAGLKPGNYFVHAQQGAQQYGASFLKQ